MEKQTVRPAHIRRRHILARLLLSAAAVVILLPVVLTALYSFFSPGEIKAFMQTRGSFDAKSLMEIKLSPNMFSLSQYYKILIEDMTILRYFVNSAMYTAAILFGQALLIPAMAYALSRFRFRGRDALFFVVIMLMLLPFQVTMVPNVITLRAMGLLDTIWAIILPMTVAPFYIFLLRQYMVGLPGDMIEAAQIDGCGNLRFFFTIALPLSKAVISVIALWTAVGQWNSYFNALIYIRDENLYPLALIMRNILVTQQIQSALGTGEAALIALRKANLMRYAMIIVATVPIMCVYPFVQKDFDQGVMIGAVKG